MRKQPAPVDEFMTTPAAKLETPVPVYFVRYIYGHHAARGGYHHFSEHLGEVVSISPAMRLLGETVLRLPGKFLSWYGGQFEYSRHDYVMELQTMLHMSRRRGCLYHITNGEKSYRLLAGRQGYRGHRIIATLHHPREHFEWLFRSTAHFRKLDHALVVSTSQIEWVEELVGPGKVSFVPCGIDTDYFTPATAAADKPFRCVFLGTHMRDLDTMQNIIRLVNDARPDIEFVLMSLNRGCARLADGKRVRWLRQIPDDEYLRQIQSADLLVLPLKGSTLVSSVLESLACGLPVLTTRGGISDYLDDDCSLQFAAGDADGMAEAVLALAKDDARRQRMAQASRRRALQFTWPIVSAKMLEAYQRIKAAT